MKTIIDEELCLSAKLELKQIGKRSDSSIFVTLTCLKIYKGCRVKVIN